MQENLLWRFICMQFVITLSLHHDIWSCQTKNPVYLVSLSLFVKLAKFRNMS